MHTDVLNTGLLLLLLLFACFLWKDVNRRHAMVIVLMNRLLETEERALKKDLEQETGRIEGHLKQTDVPRSSDPDVKLPEH